MLESIRGEKEVQENLTFAYDSVETENKNKEVLKCQTCNHILKPGYFKEKLGSR